MDTRMKFLEHELAEQEREMNIKHEAGTDAGAAPVKSENTDALERKVRELEAMVKGLTEEMLDLKSVTRKLAMQLEEMRGGQSRVHAESRFGQKKPEPAPETGRPAAGIPPRGAPVRAAPGRRPIADIDEEPVRAPAPRAAAPRAAQPVTPVRAGTSRHAISSPAPEPVPVPEPEVPVEQLKAGEFEYVMQPDGTIQKRKKTTDHSVIIAGTGYNPGHTSRSMAIRADSEAVIEAAEDDTVMDDAKRRR
ncbi:MAG: hypothetical protein O0X57_01900 [Methanocorpusculum sp.]|nr:hypothetical protein [Methanocorpusculum sp.]